MKNCKQIATEWGGLSERTVNDLCKKKIRLMVL